MWKMCYVAYTYMNWTGKNCVDNLPFHVLFQIWCRMLYTSTTYFRTTAYMAMFSEGLFLYRKIARVMHMNAREPTARYFVLTWGESKCFHFAFGKEAEPNAATLLIIVPAVYTDIHDCQCTTYSLNDVPWISYIYPHYETFRCVLSVIWVAAIDQNNIKSISRISHYIHIEAYPLITQTHHNPKAV